MTRGRRLAGVAVVGLVLVIVVWQVTSAAWTAAAAPLSHESPVPLVLAGSCFAVLARTLRGVHKP